MLLDDTGGEGGMRKEGRHVKMVVSLDEDSKWGEVRPVWKIDLVKIVIVPVGFLVSKTTLVFPSQEGRPRHFLIGCIGVSGKTKWDVLDGVVRRLFKVNINRDNCNIESDNKTMSETPRHQCFKKVFQR